MKPTVMTKMFMDLLPTICDKETSADPEHWTPENPLCGHCAVVALVAQNLFGGELLRASLAEIPEFAHMRSHYWNSFDDGHLVDFTSPQFGDHYPKDLVSKAEIRTRAYLLSSPETAKRYKLLAYRLAKSMSNNAPIFDDDIYRQCFYAALDSECQKMWFGCVITSSNNIALPHTVGEGCNKKIDALKCLCDPKCVRFGITSRTESMLGACGHAEEQALWDAVHRHGVPIHECELYVAGVYPSGLPWLKDRPEHTCLRCAVQMHYAKIRDIYVPTAEGWARLSTDEALKTALSYATQEKKI